MKNRYVINFVYLLLVFAGLGGTQNAFGQSADLRVLGQLDCARNSYTAVVQIKAASATSFSIGTSSIYLTYNPSSLSFASYQSQNFSPANLCISNAASSWDNHLFDGSTPGVFNLTLTLLVNTFSCPVVTNSDWITIGTIAFSVVNPTANPTIAFNNGLTNFNSAPANDGSNPIAKNTLTGINQPAGLYSSVVLTAGASACNPATNSYVLSGTATVSNPGAAGTLTLVSGALSQTVAIAGGSTTVPYSISGLPSVGGTQTVTVFAPNCGSATTSYAVPASCSAAPPVNCSVSLAATPGACNPATNQYTLSGVLSLTNATQAQSITITNGVQSATAALAANTGTYSFSLNGLTSDGVARTLTVLFSGTACSSVSQQYTAPASCSVAPPAPCAVSVAVTPGVCNSATNQYTLSGVLSLTNATQAQSVTITNGVQSVTAALAANTSSFSFTMNGLPSDGATRTVTVLFSGTACSTTSQQYTAPASCSCAPAVLSNVTVTRATCSGTAVNNDGSIQISATNASSYLVTGPGISMTTPAPLVNGQATVSNLPNPSATASYTVTVYATNANCASAQQTVNLPVTNCNCPPPVCVPVVAERIR